MNTRAQQAGAGRGTVSRARLRNVGAIDARTSKHRTYKKWLEKLTQKQTYVEPTLLVLPAHAQSAGSCDSSIQRPMPPIPTPFECPPSPEVSARDGIGADLLVGGLAAAGGIKVYRSVQAERQDRGIPRGSSRKKSRSMAARSTARTLNRAPGRPRAFSGPPATPPLEIQ